jgi:hypothetical protein
MNVIEPLTVTDTVFTASNVPEDDYAAWNSGTSYTIGQQVILVSTHSVYEAVATSTNKNPPDNIFDATTNPSGQWLRVGATNRWKAFDGKVGDQTSRADTITYTLTTPRLSDSIAFFGIVAESIRVVVKDTGSVVVYDVTKDIVDTSIIVDWFTYFTWESFYDTETLFLGVPAYASHTVEITISAPSTTAKIGQIVWGRNRKLGETISGTEIGIRDFSRKDRDDFGNAILIKRGFIRTVNFNFVMPVQDERRVQRVLSTLLAVPSVYYATSNTIDRGTLVYGFFPDFSAPLSSAGVTFASLEVESLS